MESLNIKSLDCYAHTGSVLSLVNGYFMHDNQSQTHWIYAAAIMDSDGCFMINRYKRGARYDYLATIKITMVNNGSINYIMNSSGLGYVNINGIRTSRPYSLPLYEYRITNRNDLIIFLTAIMPYLQNKKERAEHLLNYCNKIGYKPHGQRHIKMTDEELQFREDSYLKMRKLNKIKVGATTKSYGPEKVCDSLIS